ncbi:MAG: formimidoylglutamase [Phycisphaerales bacterium]|nr:formimidoylglutamase [Phycisphaerales bacterium]
MTLIPHTSPPHYPDAIAPARFAAHIQQMLPVGCRVAILGLPDDLGVRLNNGRPGAKDGPRAFREALSRYGVAEPAEWSWPKVFDAGDVMPAPGSDEAALTETHRRVTEATAKLLDLGLFPIAIGGGHDLTFPFVRAVITRFGPLAGVYYDAHLDVRDTAGSGMPFRRLVESCGVQRLYNLGLDHWANTRSHVTWFRAHGGDFCEGLLPHVEAPPGGCFASFDLDVIDMSAAPGVSAPNPQGWTANMASVAVHEAGRQLPLRCFDLMELNPAHDEGGRTARLAAHLFLSFLRGFAARVG